MPDIAQPAAPPPKPGLTLQQSLLIAVIGFLTLVDLFATQAILPSLAKVYGVKPCGDWARGQCEHARHGHLRPADRRVQQYRRAQARRSRLCLLFLSVPTALLAFAPNLTIFACLRVVQGLFMAGAFTLTLTHLAERCDVRTANALAAYVTGVVASNLIGRLTAAFVASLVGAEQSFLFFALLNLAGAALVSVALHRNAPEPMERSAPLLVAVDQASCRSRAAPHLRDRLPDPVRLHRRLHLRRIRPDAGRRTRCR